MAGLTIYIDDKDLKKAQKGYSWTDAQKTTPKETKPQGKYNVVATDKSWMTTQQPKSFQEVVVNEPVYDKVAKAIFPAEPSNGIVRDENGNILGEQPIEPLYGFRDPVFNVALLGAGLANGAMKGITEIGEKVVTNKPLWTAISANNIKNRIEDEGFVEGVLGHPVQTTFDLLMLGPAAKEIGAVGDALSWKYTPGLRTGIEMSRNVRNAKLNPNVELPAVTRFKLGDVEINNPNLFYRQGNNLAQDLFESGVVRTKPQQPEYIGRFNITKEFSDPMFNKGHRFYGNWNDADLLVTANSDIMHHIKPKTTNANTVYIPKQGALTPQNTSAYTFDPDYGYVKLHTTEMPSFTTWEDMLSLRPQGIHPQIKPLIEGADIEKQLSKSGTINRKQLDSYISKQKEYYQEVMNNVLNEEFNGIDKIDYAKFKSAVASRLPEYNRVNQTEFSTYGMDRLGYKVIKEPDGTGGILEYSPYTKVNTFTFETPNIYGNTTHYSGNPIGHSRTFVTNAEPNVLHVMESQSDWAQNFQPLVRRTENGKDLPVASKLTQQHLSKNYMERQIQENLKYATENVLTKMRYPTRETAAKIEGYGKPYHVYSKEDYTNIYNDYLNQKSNLRKKYNIPEDLRYLSKEELDKSFDPGDYENPTLAYNIMLEKINKLNKENVLNYNKEFSQLVRPDQWINQQPLGYRPEIETILKKYDSFPKQFQKLFGNKYEVRKVWDHGPTYSQRNSWYEVDIPESYRNKTAQIIFKSGGVKQKQSGGELDKAQKGTQAKINVIDNVNEHKFRKLYDSDNKSWYTGFTGRRGENTNGEVYLANGMSNAEIRKEFPGALIKVENGVKTFRLPKVNEEIVLPNVESKWNTVVALPEQHLVRKERELLPEKITNYVGFYRTTKNGIQNMINFTDPWTLPKWTMAFENASGEPYSDRYYKLQNEYFDNGGKDNPLEYILNKDFDEVKTTGELETLNIPNALWYNTTKRTFMVSDENGNLNYSDYNLYPNDHYSVTDNVKIYRPKKTAITTIDQNAVKRNKFINEMNDVNRIANMLNAGQNRTWNLQYQQGGPTHLQPWDEQRFRIWFNSLPEGIRNSNDYDYRGWWKENGSIPYKNGVHFTDKFKLPNHPTFSEESIYSKGNTEGGYWTKDGFVPSPYNTRNGSDSIIDYMEFAEPKGTMMFDTNGMVATFQNGGQKRRLKDNFNKFTKQELDFINNNWNTGQTFTDGEFVYVMPGDTASNLHNRNVKQTLFDNGLPRSNASMVSTSNGWRISHAMDERYAGNEGRSWDNYIVKYYIGDNKDLIPQNAQYITIDENGNYVLNNGIPRLSNGGPTGLTIIIDDEQFKKGGQIHIKEKNKGKFTKQAQSAGMSVQEFARHVLAHKDRYPASTVKRANFARNASKWNK